MDKNKKVMGLFLLLGIFLLFCFSALKQSHTVYISIRSGDGEVPVITAQLTSGETSISIDAWCSDTGEYYLFLPSWAEGRLIQTEGSGLQTVSGEGSKSFSLPILSSGQSFRLEGGQTLTILTGSQIPSVYLTLKHDLSHISSDQEQSDSGQALILSGDGETVYAGGLEKIKGRGNTSWEQEKKPYNITLQDSVTLPGMTGQTTDYSLVSSSDLTFLRNRISNEMGELAGTGSMACIRVNLYINNSFEGVYELYQRITPENMNLTDLEELTEQANPLRSEESLNQLTTGLTLDDWNQSITGKWWDYENNPENITGGYILEADNAMRYSGEASGFILESGAYMVAKSPAYLSEAQYQYISSYVQECENVMRESVGLDDYQALSAYIDIPSFVGKYLVEEVSKNIDCSSTSQYFYKDQDGLLHAGPVWDYDWAYGVERIQEEIDYMDPTGFSARDIPGSLIWWQLLYYNNAFYQDVVSLYESVLYPWLNELVETGLNQWAQELSASAVMDYLRWGRVNNDSQETSLSPSALTEAARQAYMDQVEQVRSFLAARKEFLYGEWTG
ncbi:MAG TPA: CotH kinase family protein [Candidatus Eisenbergiella intestinigallinarum]|uniref:CotH kinase family protein n=1 Tax=Candidatus Eisenbergiella intestinigallinarum TaxID=2838549 RepID=A0A9D2QKI1_9FIRM|nr:CotH kinase family protein [Candidatus Eisenbergiella intestinigallinarum]